LNDALSWLLTKAGFTRAALIATQPVAAFAARFQRVGLRLRSRAMQNAQNLMSGFRFIAALMSIIIGLGVTNLLAAPQAFYRRNENPSMKSTCPNRSRRSWPCCFAMVGHV